jgi:hypothetical protein
MAKLYGHIGDAARRQAVEAIGTIEFQPGSCANPFDVSVEREGRAAN